MFRLLIFFSIMLTACGSSGAQLPTLATPPLIVRAAYVTAEIQSTQDARAAQAEKLASENATQAAALTLTAIPPAQTVTAGTAQAVALKAAVESRHVTETASAEAVNNSNAATAEAFGTQASLSVTQIAVTRVISESLLAVANIESSARRADERANAGQLFLFAMAIIAALGIAFLIGAFINRIDVEHRARAKQIITEGEANAEATKAEGAANAAATIAKAEAIAWSEAMRARVFSVVGGLVLFNDNHDPVVVNRPGLLDSNAAPQLAAAPPQPPMINSAAGSRPLVSAARQAVSDFLWKAVRRSGEYAKTIDTIPSHKTMGIGAEGWSDMVHALEQMGFAEVVPSKGTRIRQYRTLEELARAVSNGAGIITPPPQPTPSENEEPFSGNGQNGGNGQNTLRSGTEAER